MCMKSKVVRKTRERCLNNSRLTPGAHKRYSKMTKSNENILLPDFDVNYILKDL